MIIHRRPLRSDSKKEKWAEISSFFDSSPLPNEPDYSFLEYSIEQCVEWKRYVEQDVVEEYDLQNEEEATPDPKPRKAKKKADNKQPPQSLKLLKEDEEKRKKSQIEGVESFIEKEKLWVLYGLEQKPTKSTKTQTFQMELPEGEGLRLLNTGKDFKIPWNIYCPTISDERKLITWKHSLRRNEWKVNKSYEVFTRKKCECPFVECGATCSNRSLQNECASGTCASGNFDCGNRQFTDLEEALKLRSKYATGYEVVQKDKKNQCLIAIREYEPETLIIEYTGEVIDLVEVDRRLDTVYKDTDVFRFLGLDDNLVIDAGQRGSAARFANHSCDPNAEIQKWYVNSEPRIGLFAKKLIKPNDEITYNYNFEFYENSEPLECNCGSENCRGIVGKLPTKKPEEDELSNLSDLSEHDDAFDRSSADLAKSKEEAGTSTISKTTVKELKPSPKPESGSNKVPESKPNRKTSPARTKKLRSRAIGTPPSASEESSFEPDVNSESDDSHENSQENESSDSDLPVFSKNNKRRRTIIDYDQQDEELPRKTTRPTPTSTSTSASTSTEPKTSPSLSSPTKRLLRDRNLRTKNKETRYSIRTRKLAEQNESKTKNAPPQSLNFNQYSAVKKSKRTNSAPVTLKSKEKPHKEENQFENTYDFEDQKPIGENRDDYEREDEDETMDETYPNDNNHRLVHVPKDNHRYRQNNFDPRYNQYGGYFPDPYYQNHYPLEQYYPPEEANGNGGYPPAPPIGPPIPPYGYGYGYGYNYGYPNYYQQNYRGYPSRNGPPPSDSKEVSRAKSNTSDRSPNQYPYQNGSAPPQGYPNNPWGSQGEGYQGSYYGGYHYPPPPPPPGSEFRGSSSGAYYDPSDILDGEEGEHIDAPSSPESEPMEDIGPARETNSTPSDPRRRRG